jgi:hypothetical protein
MKVHNSQVAEKKPKKKTVLAYIACFILVIANAV